MRIIPAIDIIDGRCVRLTQGDYTTKRIYKEDPLKIARSFETHGIQYLHLVDLDGARSRHIVNYSVLEKICSKTTLKVDFGGGIKSEQDVKIAFDCGAEQITGGTVAGRSPHLFKKWLSKYGAEKIILGADSLNGKIAVNGWTKYADINTVDFIKSYETEGIQYVICTDINKDGMLRGPSFSLYKEIITHTNGKLIASGGIRSVNDLLELKGLGCEGAIIGKAIYENKITLKELSKLC